MSDLERHFDGDIMRRWSSLLLSLWIAFWPQIGWAVYGEHSVSSDVLAYWKLNGDATDETGTYDGTLQNSPTATYSVLGQGYNLDDASSQYISTTLDLSGATAFTLMAWVKKDASGDNLYISDDYNATNVKIQIGYYQDGKCYYAAGGNANIWFVSDPTTWTQVALTFDAALESNEVKLYENGELSHERSNSQTEVPVNVGNLEIGRRLKSGIYSDGTVDDVIVWSRALSADEIRQVYAVQKGRYQILGMLDKMPYSDRIDASPHYVSLLSWRCDSEYGIRRVA